MKIIVVGIGKVGYVVAEQLSNENHDITIVDKNESAIIDAISNIDVIGVNGNGAAYHILREAGVTDCDLLIALTGSDETNLLCCLLAKKLGAKGTIARVRNHEYNLEIDFIKNSLDLAMVVNPEKETATEIMRILKYPSALNIDTFSNGKIDLISFVVDKTCLLASKHIKDFFSKFDGKALICAIERDGEVYIPSGDFLIEENDTVAVLSTHDEVSYFFKQIGYPVNNINKVMLIGGGRIAHYLAVLMDKLDMNITIIEKEPKVAESLSYLLPHANIICGDGTSKSLLLEEGLADVDAICSLTGIDEENILLSLFAKGTDKKIKTITKVNRTAFQEVIKSLNLGSVVYPKYTTANFILQHVRSRQSKIGSNVETLYKIIDNKIEALEFHVGEDSRMLNKTLEELSLNKNVLIGCISRQGKVFIAHGQDRLCAGDSVVIVTTLTGLTNLDKIER